MPDDLETRMSTAAAEIGDGIADLVVEAHQASALAPPGQHNLFVAAAGCGVAIGSLFHHGPPDLIAYAVRTFEAALRESYTLHRDSCPGCAPRLH